MFVKKGKKSDKAGESARTGDSSLLMYMDMHHTLKFIDEFKYIVDEYNDTYHSTIKKAPRDVNNEDEHIRELINRKYNKALNDEIKFNIGDKVRFIKNISSFQKGSTAKWSKEIHKIVSKTEHSYTLDNGKIYKYYELQLIKNSQSQPIIKINKPIEQLEKENKQKRNIRREGIDLNIVKGKRNIQKSIKLKDYIN